MSARVLVVEDDHALATILGRYLTQAGYDVLTAADGREGLDLARTGQPDLVVLDLMMPKVDGWDVCRILRAESDVPIIMATARSTTEDALLGLDLGADDYLAKPFSPRELVARVRTVLRRARPDAAAEPLMSVGGLTVDRERHRVQVDDREIPLTPSEFAILAALAERPGRVMTREQLGAAAFGWDHTGSTRTLDVHVLNLRRKLGDAPDDPRFVETVYGVGYRLVEPPP